MSQVNELMSVLEDAKAQEITLIDIRQEADFADYFIICNATSGRHAKTIAQTCTAAAKQGKYLHHLEEDPQMEWLIVDCFDVVVHIMQQDVRDFYQLETLWQLEKNHEPHSEKN
ncbi:ribosome silencing factor [Gammaproteobacteria bacterium]|nr:ribosome silencing factor [Gammaproteobacteria bacterium]